MKRLLIGAGVLLLSVFTLNAQIVNLFTPGIPEISIKQNVQFNLIPDTKEKGVGFSTIAEFDFNELKTDLGINLANQQYDVTANAFYGPTFFNILNVGVGLTYHLNHYPSVFVEQDFLTEVFIKLQPCEKFMISTGFGGFYKFTSLNEIPADFTEFVKAFNFNLIAVWYPHDLFSCYFSYDTKSYFNYPSFLSLFLNAGVEFEVIKDRFSTGMDVCTKWYDVIVAVQNLSQLNFKIFGRYKI